MNVINVSPVPGTTLAENKDEAKRLRQRELLPSLERNERVIVDFEGIQTATQSFVHALIADAVQRYGDDVFDLVEFRNCAPGVQHIVRTVFEYTLLAKANAARASTDHDGG